MPAERLQKVLVADAAMTIALKRLSNDIDLLDRKKVTYFLVFENTETGKEFRLPVPEDTAEAALREFFGGPDPVPAVAPAPPANDETVPSMDDEDETAFATQFSAEDVSAEGVPYDIYEGGPSSEDEVPSL